MRIFLIFSIIINFILGYLLCTENRTISNDNKIDSLESELLIIKNKRDSINKEIDTVYIKIKVIEKEYEEKYINIINNSPSEDYIFFTNYIERFDSINNSRAIKEN